MSSPAVVQNQPLLRTKMVIEFSSGAPDVRSERLCWMDPSGTYAVLVNVFDDDTPLFRKAHCSEIESALKDRTARDVLDPFPWVVGPDHEYSAARLKERNKHKKALAILLEQPNKMFDDHERGKLIREMTSRDPDDELYLSKPRVYALLRRYCQRGMVDNALIPDRHKAGWTLAQRRAKPPKNKLGTDRKGATEEDRRAGFVFTEEWKDKFFPVIEELYEKPLARNGRHRSWTTIRQESCEDLLRQGHAVDSDGVRRVIMPPDSALPTPDQLHRLYDARKLDLPESLQNRLGKARFNAHCRPSNGDQRDIASEPMHIVQMDSEVTKLFLVDDCTKLVIARPTLVMIRDTMSRLIAGYALTWEHERFAAYALALENMATDKVAFCASFGCDIKEEWWPCHHWPEIILADNGPMITKQAGYLMTAFGTQVLNTGTKRPDMKPVIESGFDDINDDLILNLPGAVLYSSTDQYAEKYERQARENARITMWRLNRLVIKYIIRYNTTRILKKYPLTDVMINQVDPIPCLLWQFGVTHSSGKLREVDPDVVRRNCFMPGEASVTRDGMYFRGSHYLCQSCIDEGWREKAAVLKGPPPRIPILYDIRRRGIIYRRNDVNRLLEGQKALEPCWIIRCKGEDTDISFYEREFRLKIKDARIRRASEARPQNNADFRAEVDAECKQAESEYRQVRGALDQPKTGGKSRREEAREEERDQIHANAGLPESVVQIPRSSLTPNATEPFFDDNEDEEMILNGIPNNKCA